ncbi:acyltransferase [Aureimonas sp. SK2]|uniref:acyltransferase family protein n=1 Tax=Aureimonas sp. SK2 TaxID=3015992 RepID=UPI002444606C|nr:acyltransferase [Aureimonas sp. SK2]
MQRVGEGRFEPLDGLRGIAVLAVLACHTSNIPEAGRIGVDLFFVLSGFLITDIIARGYDDGPTRFFPGFFKRRFFRLYPALILACLLYAGLATAFPWFDGDAPRSVAASLMMVSNYTQAAGLGFPTGFGHTWSLATEWQFYLLWPVVYFAVRSCGGGTRALLATLAVAVVGVWTSRYATHDTIWNWRSLDARGDGLLYGCMIAVTLRAVPSFKLPATVTWAATAGFACALFVPSTWEHYWSNAISAVLILGVIGGSATTLNDALSLPALTYLGRISYGLYLYHFPLAAIFYVAGFGPLENFVLTAGISVPLSMLSWRFLERPILELTRGRGRGGSAGLREASASN